MDIDDDTSQYLYHAQQQPETYPTIDERLQMAHREWKRYEASGFPCFANRSAKHINIALNDISEEQEHAQD